jgi:hypothetical protein
VEPAAAILRTEERSVHCRAEKINYSDQNPPCEVIFIQVKEDEMVRACSTNGEKRNSYRILVGMPEEKRPLGRPRCRWVNNIRMDLRAIGWDGMDWIDLAQNREQWRALVKAVINIRVP